MSDTSSSEYAKRSRFRAVLLRLAVGLVLSLVVFAVMLYVLTWAIACGLAP